MFVGFPGADRDRADPNRDPDRRTNGSADPGSRANT